MIRHRIANRMLLWRAIHVLPLWVGARLTALIVVAVNGGGLFLPTGVDFAVLFATVAMLLEWVDERRKSLAVIYSNLGYSSSSMRLLAFSIALAAELTFNALMFAVR